MTRRGRVVRVALACVLGACPERPSVNEDVIGVGHETWGGITGDAPVTTGGSASKFGPAVARWRDVHTAQRLAASLPPERGTILLPDVVLGGRAYVGTQDRLRAIDLGTGAESWSVAMPFSMGAFAAGKVADATLLCGWGTGGTTYVCLTAADGSEAWRANSANQYGAPTDVLFVGGTVHFLSGGDYGGVHGIFDAATGAKLVEAGSYGWISGLVQAGPDVLATGELTNNAGVREFPLVARDGTTGAVRATSPTGGGFGDVVLVDDTGAVLRLKTASGAEYRRYEAGAFTVVTGLYEDLEAAFDGLPYSTRVTAAGKVKDGVAWVFEGNSLCKLPLGAPSTGFCAGAPSGTVGAWQEAPNAIVGLDVTYGRYWLFDPATGRAFTSGAPTVAGFQFERWIFTDGRWYGGN